MTTLSLLLALTMQVLSVPLSLLLSGTSKVLATVRATLEIPEPTTQFWKNRSQQYQVSTFTGDRGFIVDLPTEHIANNYAHTGPDAK